MHLRRGPSLLVAVVMLGSALPGLAQTLGACKPGVWTADYRLAYAKRDGECPQVDDTLTSLANSAQFVTTCGEQRMCGTLYMHVRVNGRLFLVPSEQVKALAYVYPSHLPRMLEDTPQPTCTLGRATASGADFYPLQDLAGPGSQVQTVLRLRPEAPLVACRRQGNLVLAWLRGRPGLVPRGDLELSDRRHPQAFWVPPAPDANGKTPAMPQGPFCLRPTWRGVALRATVLYLPTREKGGTDENSMVQPGEEIEILSLHRSANADDLWYFAGHSAVRGFVRARDIRHSNDLTLADPAGPMSGCPVQAPLVRLVRDVQAHPLRWLEPGKLDHPPEKLLLGTGLEVPVVARQKDGSVDVIVDGIVARVADPTALAAPHRQLAMTFEPADLVRKVDPGGADQAQAFHDLLEGIPDLRLPIVDARADVMPGGPHTAAELVALQAKGVTRQALRESVVGKGPVRTPLDAQMHEAMAQKQDARPKQPKPQQGVLRQITAIEYDAGHRMHHGDPYGALVQLADCLDIPSPETGCATPTARFLAAEALLRLGYNAVAAELLLDVMASGHGPLEQALAGYREASKRFAPSPRAMRVLLPYCDGSVAVDPEACFLGLQAAVDAEDVTGGLPFASQLRHLKMDGRQRALVALFDGAYRGAREDSAVDFAMAVQEGCKGCSKRSELAQTLLTQAARAAWEVGDIEAAWRAIRNMVPEMVRENGDLVATVLFAVDKPGPARRLLLALEDQVGDRRPEVTLWKAHLQLAECRFTQAKATEATLDKRARALLRSVPVVQAAMTQARGTLNALLRLDDGLRKVGLPSRLIPELDRVLRPTGVCGQWRQVIRERDGLVDKLDNSDTALPRSLAAQLKARIAEAEGRCFDGLQLASDEMAARVQALASRRSELQIDAMEVLVTQLDRAQQLVGKVHDEATTRMVADMLADAGKGAWAATVAALEHPAFPVRQTLAQVQATPAEQRERVARSLFERLLANCGVGAVEKPGDNPAAEALDAEVTRSLRCLGQLSRGGISPDVQPLLYRYLPAVRYVRAQHLQRLERATFHAELWRQLQAWARQNQPGDDLCLPEGGELLAIEVVPTAVGAR